MTPCSHCSGGSILQFNDGTSRCHACGRSPDVTVRFSKDLTLGERQPEQLPVFKGKNALTHLTYRNGSILT